MCMHLCVYEYVLCPSNLSWRALSEQGLSPFLFVSPGANTTLDTLNNYKKLSEDSWLETLRD